MPKNECDEHESEDGMQNMGKLQVFADLHYFGDCGYFWNAFPWDCLLSFSFEEFSVNWRVFSFETQKKGIMPKKYSVFLKLGIFSILAKFCDF